MNDEALSTIKEKFSDEVSKNKELRAIAKRISAGKADFSDTARYNDIASDILGSVFSEYVPELDSQGLKERICTELLRSQYADINDILAQVQTSLDEKKGIKIAPQKAAFPIDRVKKSLIPLKIRPFLLKQFKDVPEHPAQMYQNLFMMII